MWGLWVVEAVLDDPERYVGEPKVEMSENDRQVFIALIMTESSFRQFAEDGSTLDSGIDCDGLAQICANPAIMDPALRWNPMENVYAGAKYFANLLDKWDGNYAMAIAEYKGAINTLPSGQTRPNPDHPVVSDLFDHLSLR
jgi:soluble lytic murein transglycosylase-like protein